MLKKLSISHRLWLISSVSGSLFAASVAMGWIGLQAGRDSGYALYAEGAIPIHNLAKIGASMDANYSEIFRAYQHDPTNPLSAIHNHTVTSHTQAVRESNNEIDRVWDEYYKLIKHPPEMALDAPGVFGGRARKLAAFASQPEAKENCGAAADKTCELAAYTKQ
jgi:methyl-accepting chemotaxis protein